MGYFRRNSSSTPRTINAKFDGICNETGVKIRKGEKCVYDPDSRKIYHPDSRQAQQWREAAADEDYLNRQMQQNNGWWGLAY